MRRFLALSLLLFVPLVVLPADPVQPQPPPSLGEGKPLTVEVGKKCVLTVETGAKKVTWKIPAGVETLAIDGKRLAVWATEGVYTFAAMVPNGDEVLHTEIILTVTGPRPPPTPPDQFTKALQDAFAATPDAEKPLVPLLAAVWADELRHLDTELNGGAVLDALVAGRRAAPIADAQLRTIRNVIDAPLIPIFGTKSIPLTKEVVAAAKAQFQKTVDALTTLK